MKSILQQRGLRLIFIANVVSMIGSGMNNAATTWYVLKTTGSEVYLGWLVVMATLPGALMLPFTGVIIDREDRRRLLMLLDMLRGLIILGIAGLALTHRVHLWQLYGMHVLVSAGFWMFWPTITALIQELTPSDSYVVSNSFLMAGVQGGWLIAGSVVGFVYDHIGLGGVLLIDAATYGVSLTCYLLVRKGRHVVERPVLPEHIEAAGAVRRYFHELHEGLAYLRGKTAVILMGLSWSAFLGAMMTQGVVTAPFSERILHGGAVGYGWLNAGWGIGAFFSSFYLPALIRRLHARTCVGISMAILAASLFAAPYARWLALAVALFFLMGSARGTAGTAISSHMMEMVPKHFMGRVQNTFYFVGTLLQIALGLGVGTVAHRVGLAQAFAMIGVVYALSFLTTLIPVPQPKAEDVAVEATA